jgi:hypothetical protein
MEDNRKIKVLIRFDGKESALTLHSYKSDIIQNPNQMCIIHFDYHNYNAL